MTRGELAKGSATFLAVIVSGFLSTTYLDQRFTTVDADAGKTAKPNDRPETTAPSNSSTACVSKDGSWKNWPWSNVPMLSPKCADNR
jgi:hypothetical protein